MKKNLFITTSAIVISLGVFVFQNVNSKTTVNSVSDLLLSNVEALSGVEYTKGDWGSNWKTYSITCTAQTTSTTTTSGSADWHWDANVQAYVQGIPIGVGGGGSASGSSTTTTTTTYQPMTYNKEVCGSGSGSCKSAAPSGHPCA